MLDHDSEGCVKKKKNPPSGQGKQERRATPQKGGGIYIQKQNAQNSTVSSKKCM